MNSLRGIFQVILRFRPRQQAMSTSTIDITPEPTVPEAKELIAELCRNFYSWGWVSGTGGGISVKAEDKIVMAPSGVMKERMQPKDMFVLDHDGQILEEPALRKDGTKLKLSECSPLFMSAYKMRGAGAVMHSHSMNAILATMIDPTASEFRVTDLEMIKGIIGHSFYGGCIVPIIENTARECELTERLQAAIKLYPDANAVLVRRHGVYVWGPDWVKAKTQAECYDYLFEAAVKMRQMGIDASVAPEQHIDPDHIITLANNPDARCTVASDNGHVAKKAKTTSRTPKCVVLDIEGTVAPVSFVADVLFPYAREHTRPYLWDTFLSKETTLDILLLRGQAGQDLTDGTSSVKIPNKWKTEIVEGCVAYVHEQMDKDRKSTALKNLQGHVWREGYKSGKLKGELYGDLKPALDAWSRKGIKTYIYSSGSREAQHLIFTYSNLGDLRNQLCGYFDTTSGSKLEPKSYTNIALSLGVDDPSEILFATDNVQEIIAAQTAGWGVVAVDRPGNKPLAELPQGVRTITSMLELLE